MTNDEIGDSKRLNQYSVESESADLSRRVVKGFGEEWSRFTNQALSDHELREMFELYATVFPWLDLPENAVGFDAGCGSGRWATFFAPRVGLLHCIDASDAALEIARRTLAEHTNVVFHHQDICELGLPVGSCDFGYSLGVLHHIPDTELATAACVQKLKPGAPFLVYLYYDLESRGRLQRLLLAVVTTIRHIVARLPRKLRLLVADVIGALVYWPLARFARLLEKVGKDPSWVPLFQYRRRSFYVMRNDALDRFGTRLEKRYSRDDVRVLLETAGLENVVFAEGPPWWVAVGWRRQDSW
jgi:SAM-dependent methyltransferase